MTWVDLSSAFAYGTKLTSTQMQQLRDNFTALANGDAGAPIIKSEALENNIIGTAELHTATGYSGGSGTGSVVYFVMQDYCFAPMISNLAIASLSGWYGSDPANYVARFGMSTTSAVAYAVRWRYVTATDKPFIYAIKNPTTGEIEHIWTCEDPPPDYWGMDEPPTDFIPPLSLSAADDEIIRPASADEIIIFNYDNNEYKEIMERSATNKIMLHTMLNADYELEAGSKIFTRKNLAQI